MSGYREICLIFVLVSQSPAILERRNPPVGDFPAYALHYNVTYDFSDKNNPSDCSRKLGERFLSDAFVDRRQDLQELCPNAKVIVRMMAFVEVFPESSKMLIKTSLNVTVLDENVERSREQIERCYQSVNATIMRSNYTFKVHTLHVEGCPQLTMDPPRLYNTDGSWVCANNNSYHNRTWSCLPNGHSPGVGVQTPIPDDDEIELIETTNQPDMTTPEMKNHWGLQLRTQHQGNLIVALVEGDDTVDIPFTVWVNRSKLCNQEEFCKLSINIDIYDDSSNSQPICRRTGRSIPQVVAAYPKVSLSNNDNFCSISVPEHHSSFDDVISLKAVMDGKYDGLQKRFLAISLTRLTGKDYKEVLRDKKETIPIEIEDLDKKATCQSINDPHITTFDGLEYNNYFEGEYVMYQHKKLSLRVDLVYQKCEHEVAASCNCAVAVQSGDDVIVIDRCYRDKPSINSGKPGNATKSDKLRIPRTRMSVQMYLNDKLTPGTQVFQEADGKKYFIYLPNGAYVKVMVSGELVNAWIVASPSDFKNTLGMCGYYNGIKNDDIMLRNGKVLNYPNILDGGRGQPKEFIEHWRVELYTDKSILFGTRKAKKVIEPQKYCTCERDLPENMQNKCYYGADISNCDVQKGRDVTDWLISRAVAPILPEMRKKRQTDNNINIYANEPLIKIDKKFIPPTYHWDSKWNEVTAKDHCQKYIKDEYKIGQLCADIPGVDFNREVATCIEDIQIIKNTTWADSARDAMKEQCLEAVQKNSSLPNDVAHKIENAMCINDCSDHGKCVQGLCRCQTGYTTADCSVDERLPPYSPELPRFGLCDVRNMNCSHVIVYGQDFIPSPNLTCFLQECEVTDSVKPVGAVIKVKGTLVNFNAVECPVPSTRSYLISVSNNGVDASDALLFIPFDPVCNTCNTFNKTCKKKHNSCRIDGLCYKTGEHSPTDECLVCEPVDDGFQWTTRKDVNCRPAWWKDIQLPDWVVAVAAAVGGSLIGVLVGFLLYKCCCKSKKSSSGTEQTMDLPSDPDGPPAFEDAMLHRNRGLHVFPDDRFTELDLPHVDEYEESYFYNGDGRGVENGVDSTTYF